MGNTQNGKALARVQQRLGQEQLARAATMPNFLVSGSTVNGVTFEVAQGSIADESTDAIVNPTDSQFSLSGALSQAIVARGGTEIELECQSIGTLTDKGAITSGGALRCKHVVHVLAPRTLPECQNAALAAVRLVCSKHLRSVAFPLFGGGALGVPADQVASAITNALVLAAREGACGRSLKRIRLVGYSAAEQTEFDNALRESISGGDEVPVSRVRDSIPPPEPLPRSKRSASESDLVQAASLAPAPPEPVHAASPSPPTSPPPPPLPPAPSRYSPLATTASPGPGYASPVPQASRAPVPLPAGPSPQYPLPLPPQAKATNTTYSTQLIGGVSVEAVEGDITNESSDAIVNPTDAQLLLTGNLSQAIVAKCPSIVQECNSIGTLTSAELTNAGGSLFCRHVLHVLFPTSLQECEQTIRDALQVADTHGLCSLSIPPIGVGGGHIPLQQAASTIVDTVVAEARVGSLGSVTQVRLVGFNPSQRQAFETALKNAVSGNSPAPLPVPLPAPLGLGTTPNAARNFAPSGFHAASGGHFGTNAKQPFNAPATSVSSRTIGGVRIEVTRSDLTDEATDAIVNPTSANFGLDGALSMAITSKGGATIAQECRQLGTLSTAGAITSAGQLQCTRVIHVLSPTDLNECQAAVRAALRIASNNSLRSISFPLIGCGGRRLRYSQVASIIASEVVGSARANSFGSITLVRFVAFDANQYTAYDNALQQASSGGALPISNQPIFGLNPGAVNPNPGPPNGQVSAVGPLPPSWKPMKTNKPSQLEEIQKSDSDYRDAQKLFTLSGRTVYHIYRIQNPFLYSQYIAEKNMMDSLYAGQWKYKSSIEWILYHGTDSGTLAKINGKGFDRSYCGKNATMFGQGSYFARDMAYSAQQRYSPPDGAGHKWVYAARVLVGLYCQGTMNMQHPPNQPNGYPYDTAVDNSANPTIFVIFRDARAYPLYLYEFS